MQLKYLLPALAMACAMQVTLANAACDEGETVVRFSHVVAAEGHPKGEAAAYLAERVNGEMDGTLCMEVYPDSTLYEDDAALQALVSGDLELAAPSSARFDAYTDALRLFDLPFLFRDAADLEAFAQSAPGRGLLAELQQHGLVGLDYWLAGFKQFSADRPLLTPADADGLAFRVQDSELSVAMIESLGAEAKVIPLGEVRHALESGAINGQENTWSNIATQRLDEVQDGVTETNHQAFTYVLVTAEAFLDGLDPDMRAQLLDIIEDATHEANAHFAEFEAENRKQIAEGGTPIRKLSEEQRQEWVAAMETVRERFAERIGRETVEAAAGNGK